MIANVKKYLLQLLCVVALLGCMTACNDVTINLDKGNGNSTENGDDNGGNGGNSGNDENAVELAGCWHLVSLYGSEVDVDIYIDFGKDGKFVIYQRIEELAYTTFKGTYTVDAENSVVSGVYDDGEAWLSDYNYVVDKENKTITLTSTENPSEVAVYEASKVPASATTKSRSASIRDVKPL